MASPEQWPFCMNLARSMVKDLQLDYYDDPKRLNFIEALHLIKSKRVLGSGIPSELTCAPWLLESVTGSAPALDTVEKVNRLLRLSMRVQMGCIPNTEFKDFIVSNLFMSTAGLVHLYLSQLGVDSDIACGSFLFSLKPNSDGTPHVWLNICGQIIDTTFVYIAPHKGDQKLFFKSKSPKMYVQEDLTCTTRRLYFGNDGLCDNQVCAARSMKLFAQYACNSYIEKFVAMALNMAFIHPGIKMYDIIMKEEIRSQFGVVVADVEHKWSERCWKCEATLQKLKMCSVCKVARYCNPDCQKADWNSHKTLHKEWTHYISTASSSSSNSTDAI